MKYLPIIILLILISCNKEPEVKVTKTFDNGATLQEWIFINGKDDSLNYDVRQYNEDGSLELTGQIRNDMKEGIYTWFYPNGNKKWVEKYNKGLSVDTTYCYYEQGEQKRIIHPSSNKTRKAIEYYETGEKKIISFVTNGKFIDSTWTAYYKNGRIKELGMVKTGLKQGFWKFYGEEGRLQDSLDMTGKKKHVFDFEEEEVKQSK